MAKKTIDLPEREIEIIQKVKNENGFKTSTQALIHIIEEYNHHQEMEESKTTIYGEMNRELKDIFIGIGMSSKKTEHMVNVLLDLVNSYLLLRENDMLQFIPVSVTKAAFIKKSEEKQKMLIAERKRKKSNRQVKRIG